MALSLPVCPLLKVSHEVTAGWNAVSSEDSTADGIGKGGSASRLTHVVICRPWFITT